MESPAPRSPPTSAGGSPQPLAPVGADDDGTPESPRHGADRASQAAIQLELMWLASPTLPVGGFSYSEGLEGAIDRGWVRNEADAAAWLGNQLHLVLARCDLPLVADAFEAWQRGDDAAVVALNGWFASTRESAEFAQQSAQTGRSLLLWLKGLHPDTPGIDALESMRPAPLWPVAFALAASRTGAALEQALLAYAFGWAENMVQASLRAVPLGQRAGQRVLAGLTATIPLAIETALAHRGPERRAFAPMLAIVSAQHETQYSRLFRS